MVKIALGSLNRRKDFCALKCTSLEGCKSDFALSLQGYKAKSTFLLS